MLLRNKGFNRRKGESVRAKITTTIEEALLNQAKVLAKQEGLSGANAIIERALELYFTSIQCEVWEKIVVQRLDKEAGSKRGFYSVRNIKCRKTLENCRPDDYTPESLKAKGWRRLAASKKASVLLTET